MLNYYAAKANFIFYFCIYIELFYTPPNLCNNDVNFSTIIRLLSLHMFISSNTARLEFTFGQRTSVGDIRRVLDFVTFEQGAANLMDGLEKTREVEGEYILEKIIKKKIICRYINNGACKAMYYARML